MKVSSLKYVVSRDFTENITSNFKEVKRYLLIELFSTLFFKATQRGCKANGCRKQNRVVHSLGVCVRSSVTAEISGRLRRCIDLCQIDVPIREPKTAR